MQTQTPICVDLWIDHERNASRREEPTGDTLAWAVDGGAKRDTADSPESMHLAKTDIEAAFHVLLTELTPLERTALLLHDVYMLTAKETAVRLGSTESAVKATLRRSRRKLQAWQLDAGLFALLSYLGRVRLGTIYGFAVVYGAMAGLFNPAYSAVRAQVFTPDIRNAANSLTQISSEGVRLLGPSLGGVLMSLASATIGLVADALTFIVSIISLVFVKPNRLPLEADPDVPAAASRPGATPAASRSALRNFLYDLSGGARELFKHPWLWITVAAFSFANLCAGGITAVLLPWLIKLHLHDPAYDYGLVTSATAVGSILAAVVMGSRSRWHHRGPIAYIGVGIWGIALLCMAFTPSILVLMLLAAISGAGVMTFAVIWEGSLQELARKKRLAVSRVSISLVPLR